MSEGKQSPKPAPLAFKPDLADAARRWDAYYAGDLIDRPLVQVTAPRPGARTVPGASYHDKIYGDLDKIIDGILINAEAVYYGGESIPAYWMSFGADEVGAFCGGGELHFNESSPDTNWSTPFVDDWDKHLPLHLDEGNRLWLRMQEFYRKTVARTAGKMLLCHLDMHTNMDLLSAVRGPENLCMDCIEQPEAIDRAMTSAREVFKAIWRRISEIGRMDELGYVNGVYSMEGAAIVSCDFCCMISPEMFRRWVLPAYEEEAAIAKHVFHHWDGPGALKHAEDIVTSKGLHTLGYVPTVGFGQRLRHIECLDMLKDWQRRGKAVQACGTPEECKAMHKELLPNKVMYCTNTQTPQEAQELLEWFVKNT